MKKVLALVLAAVASSAVAAVPKYVFLFIGDGMSVPQRMIANEFSIKIGKGPLAMNDLPVSAMTRSCSANALVTDSAAAATAIACGEKTNNGMSGTAPDGRALESCAEVAKRAGRKVGIVSSVTITHATPAGFYAHRKNRGDAEGISQDLANSGFDFFAGGGLDVNESKSKAYANAQEKGYRLIRTKDEFLALKPSDGKILTRFTNGSLETAIDADEATAAQQPTLAEIVTKAIEMLDNENGFFLMAEGGRIDWSGHGNDAASNLRDVLALDEAVKVARAFQDRHPDETLLIVTGDHETGGMTMGFAGAGYNLYTQYLTNQTMSVGCFNGKVGNLFGQRKGELTFDDLHDLIHEGFGFTFGGDVKKDPMILTSAQTKSLRDAFDHDMVQYKKKVAETSDYMAQRRYILGDACRKVMSDKCGIGWTTGSHTAMPVQTTAKGVRAEDFSGYFENVEIGRRLKAIFRGE